MNLPNQRLLESIAAWIFVLAFFSLTFSPTSQVRRDLFDDTGSCESPLEVFVPDAEKPPSIYIVEEWEFETSEVALVLVDETLAVAAWRRSERAERGQLGTFRRTSGMRVICWALEEGAYRKDPDWPNGRGPRPGAEVSGGWRELEFDEAGEVVLPPGVEFAWYATRSTSKDGSWRSWRVECARASSLGLLYRSCEKIWGGRRFGFLWHPAEMIPLPPDSEPCTGVAASWCPNCGDCSCPMGEDGGRSSDAEDCPLHGASSQHADEGGGG